MHFAGGVFAADDITVGEVTLKDEDNDGYYEIGTAEELYAFAAAVNGGNVIINAKLTADITVNENVLIDGKLNSDTTVVEGFRTWTPIGNSSNTYIGKFDGAGHKISGLYYNGDKTYIGLFGFQGASGNIMNVTVEDSYFNGSSYVAGIVGCNKGIITNCTNSGMVSNTSTGIGGIVGYNEGTISNCTNSGTVISTSSIVGGIAGENISGIIQNCINAGDVSGTEKVGGIAGRNSTTFGSITIVNCYSTGTVSGNYEVGGIVGNTYQTINNCYYLEGSAQPENSYGEAKTAEQFASGEVAYLLGDAFGQKLGEDAFPVFLTSENSLHMHGASYVNVTADDGFCTCGEYEKPYGIGVAGNPFLIDNAGKLYWFADKINNDNLNYSSAYAVLTADITVNEDVIKKATLEIPNTKPLRVWTTISEYYGTFDGAGHTISGLYFKDTNAQNVGLFGHVQGSGKIMNVTVEDSYFHGSDYVAGIVCDNYGTITNCTFRGMVVNGTFTCIGGIASNNNGTITNCTNSGTVSSTNGIVGGIAGYNNSTIENCYNTGAVSSTLDQVGGIAGNNHGVIRNCYNTGAVSSTNGIVGGIAGYNFNTVTNCYNTGAVSGIGEIGGVVGSNNGPIDNCYYLEGSAPNANDNSEEKTAEQFASGEVAYRLGAAWGQKLGEDAFPVFLTEENENTHSVYSYILEGSTCTSLKFGYANEETEDAAVTHGENAHTEQNICTHFDLCGYCGNEPVKITAENYYRYGLSPSEWAKYDGYYAITDAGNLFWFAKHVNEGNTGANALLAKDIKMFYVMPGGIGIHFPGWQPIGTSENNYIGTFDGKGKEISGLYFNDTSVNSVGLFGCVGEGGTVKNVVLQNALFDVRGESSAVGGIAGINFGTIENCTFSGNLMVHGRKSYVGGIVGYNEGDITLCANDGVITIDGSNSDIGGIVGHNFHGSIKNCYNLGNIEAGGSTYVSIGGIVGGNNEGIIESCYSANGFTADGKNSALGGIAGHNNGILRDCVFVHGTANGGVGSGTGTASVLDNAFFSSGHVAWILNGGKGEGAWGQSIGTDTYPVLGGEAIYAHSNGTYSNGIAYDNGFCLEHENCYEIPKQDENGVYLIDNAGKLYWFSAAVNKGKTSINAKLTADITVNENVFVNLSGAHRAWTPIGNEQNQYTGTFDGAGHKISGLYFDDASVSRVGLFGCVGEGGTVKNVTVEDSYINGSDYVGGIAGENNGTIKNCANRGAVSFSGTNSYAGGIAGENNGTIKNCANLGAVSFSGTNSYAGGIAGENNGTIKNCYNLGKIIMNTASAYFSFIAGIIGDEGTIENCYYLATGDDGNGGKTEAQFASGEVAYLLGEAWGQTLGKGGNAFPMLGGMKVYNNGENGYGNTIDPVPEDHEHTYENGFCICGEYEAPGKDADGFCIIDNAGKLYWFAAEVNGGNTSINALLTADITVNKGVLANISGAHRAWTPIGNDQNQYTGTFDGAGHTISGLYFNDTSANSVGLFGCVGEGGTVKNVTLADSYFNAYRYVGGIVGHNIGAIENCVSTGTVTGSHSYIGGIAGMNQGTITNCASTGVLSLATHVGGIVGHNKGTIKNCYNIGEVSGNNFVGGIAGANDGTITNCYYLEGTANGGIQDTDIGGQAEPKTAEEFASGRVAYLLGEAWGQNVGTDEYPVPGGDKIIAYAYDMFAYGPITKYYTSIENAIAQNNTYITLLADVYGSVYIPSGVIIEINVGEKTIRPAATPVAYMLRSAGAGTDMIIVASGAQLTLTNGTVANNIYVSEGGQLTLGEGAEVTGTIENDGSVFIGAVPASEVNFSKAGHIEIGSAVSDKASAIEKLKFSTSDTEGHVTVIQGNQVIHGELTFELLYPVVYDGNEQIPISSSIRVWIGEYEVVPASIGRIDGYDYINAGTKEIKLILGDTNVEYTITYEISPNEISNISDFKVTLPYLSPVTQGRVTANVWFNGTDVEGTWSAVTMDEDGNYYAVFTPESKNFREYRQPINPESDLVFTAIALDKLELTNVPAFIMVDQAHKFSAAATKGETLITDFNIGNNTYIKYYYSFDENDNVGTEFYGDILDLSSIYEANGKEYIYVWAEVIEGGEGESKYFQAAITKKHTIELRRSAEVIGELEKAVNELQTAINTKADAATLNEKVEALNKAIANAEKAAKEYTDALKVQLEEAIAAAKAAAIGAADEALEKAKAELQDALNTKADTATLNEKVGALNTAIANAEKAAKEYADASDAALKSELEGKINDANTLIGALKERTEAIEGEITSLKEAVTKLSKLIAEGGDIDTINAALANITARLTALENAGGAAAPGGATSEDTDKAISELKVAVAEIKAALEGKNLGQIETNKNDIVNINAAIKNIEESLKTIDILLTEGKLEEVKAAIAEIEAAFEKIKDFEASSKFIELEAQMAELSGKVEALEQKDKALEDEIAKLKEDMQALGGEATGTLSVVTLVIAIASLMGNAALVAWGVISKRKKALVSVGASGAVKATETVEEAETAEEAETVEEAETAEEAETVEEAETAEEAETVEEAEAAEEPETDGSVEE